MGSYKELVRFDKNFTLPVFELFESAKSSEQFKNGKSEIFVKAYKLFVRDVLFLKPGARMPEFTVLGLDLLCEEASRIMCSRPIAYLGDQDLVLTPTPSFLQE